MLCPVCRATNDRGPQCRRCRADLALLFELEEQRRLTLATARAELERGAAQQALDLAIRAADLHRDDESRRLLAVCHLLCKNFAKAWRVYQSKKSASGVA